MFKNYLKGIEGITTYPMFLLVTFLVFFTGLLIYLYRADRMHMSSMGRMPLEDGTSDKFHPETENQTL